MKTVLAAAGCAIALLSGPGLRAGGPALRVVTLHTVLTEIAGEVGGDQVEVFAILKPDVDPHSFEPSAADLRRVAGADIILAAGLGLEGYLDKMAVTAGTRARVISVGDALPSILPFQGGRAGVRDPHWWQSIGNATFATEIVRKAFSEARPGEAGAFARRAQAYERRLSALRGWADGEIARLPPAKRQLVTSHDAFAYFARDFGFTVHPVAGLSPDSEPNARDVAALIDLIRREKIRAVFVESSVNPRITEGIVRETGVRPGDTLYADGLGAGEAGTYEGMYRHNVRAIVDGLE